MTTPNPDERTDADAARARLVRGSGLTERRLVLADVPTAVLEAGDGPPVVLLHGAGELFGVWLRVVDALVHTHRVVVTELPGHGGSGLPPTDLDGEAVIEWMDDLVGTTCEAPPTVVGHLLGGAIALQHAVARPDSVRALALVDTLGLARYVPKASFGIPLARFVLHPTARSRDRLFAQCFVSFDDVAAGFGDRWEDLLACALAGARSPTQQAAMKALLPAFAMRPVPVADRDALSTPTVLVHGRHDRQVPLRVARAASASHGWPLRVIEGAADDPAAERPDELLDALMDLLGLAAQTGEGVA